MPDTGSSTSFANGFLRRTGSIFSPRNKAKTGTTPQSRSAQDPSSQSSSSNPVAQQPKSSSSSGSYFSSPTSSSLPPSPRRSHRRNFSSSRRSLSSSVTDFGATLRRSASIRSSSTSHGSSKALSPTSTAALALPQSPEKGPASLQSSNASRPSISLPTFSRRQKSSENVKLLQLLDSKTPISAVDSKTAAAFGMAAIPLRHPPPARPPGPASISIVGNGVMPGGGPLPPAIPTATGSHNPQHTFQHIHDMASKRISTLDYLRKAHEGRVYWFNTLLFNKTDLSRLPYFHPRALSRRATNYLLLGFSLPTILDYNSQSPTEYLRALNSLLMEFESYQSAHPPEGPTSSSLSRGRIPQMFKRSTFAGGKGRRSSAANEMGYPGSASDHSDSSRPSTAHSTNLSMSSTSFSVPNSEHDLLPGEEYQHLLTPSLPFDPDFFETFATLCDVLIDCYTKVMGLISTPDACVPGVQELFNKADARVRKIIVAGLVREFEDASRAGVKGEVAGVGKVVLGGLM